MSGFIFFIYFFECSFIITFKESGSIISTKYPKERTQKNQLVKDVETVTVGEGDSQIESMINVVHNIRICHHLHLRKRIVK